MKNPTITHDMHIVELPHEDSCFAYFFAIDEDQGIIGIVWRE